MTTFNQAKQQNGSVVFRGVEYAITRAAVSDNFGTDGEVRYYSPAIDQQGNRYTIEWLTTSEWDASCAIAQAEMQGKDVDMDKISEEFGVDSDFSAYSLEDESDACNWDSPNSVTAE